MSFLSKMFAQGSGSNPFTPTRIEDPVREMVPPPAPTPRIPQQPRIPIYEQLFPNDRSQMDTIFKDAIPELEQARLGQRAAEMQSREKIAADKLASQEGLKNRELDIRQQRASVYEFKAKNPALKIIVGKDGMTRAYNPIDGSMIELGKTGMSEQEAADLNQKHSLERITARGDVQHDLASMRNQYMLDQIAARGANSMDLAELRAELAGNRDLLPTQQRARVQVRYNQMINEHPAWRDFVRINPNTGMPEVKPATTVKGWFGRTKGPDPETHKQILAYLYPDGQSGTGQPEEEDDIDKLINQATGGQPPRR